MNSVVKQRHKEVIMTVGTGLVINYPLNLFFLYLFITIMEITDPFTLSVLITAVMTVLAYIRVYLVRRHYDKTPNKKP
jgi:predicted neutral ceramidase superfamily lipid hydrolase